MQPRRALAYAQRNRRRFVSELVELVRFPSVSNQPKHDSDLKTCAQWLARHLRQIGMQRVSIVPSRHHPIIYATWKAGGERPTLLIYGHYDVQPAEPLSEWKSSPFQPVVRNGRLYGRGASDDKGQLFTHVKAIECLLKADGELPVNLKLLLEGDEEQGSPDLESFALRNRRALHADAALISDTRMIAPGRPTIGYSQRGNVRFELELSGARGELHSGNFGGAVVNPVQGLCEILSSLHDADGKIAVPGFYDKVREWGSEERAYMARTGPTDEQILRDTGDRGSWGERGYSAYERVTIRPALTINGISGGYAGAGIKTVIPPRAVAKLSVRTVPDQESATIEHLLRNHIEAVTPPGMKSELRTLGATDPLIIPRSHPMFCVAAFACQKGFGIEPVFVRSGGSIGGASVFDKVLRTPPVILGFALPQDNVHAPNESFLLSNFFHGIETSIWFMAAAAGLGRPSRHARQERAYDR